MDSDRLSGWKEIAAYLRRSVRAAQRWERELGLPVKRVKTAAGHVVFASRADLDAWLAQQQFDQIDQPDVEPDEETPHPAPAFAEATAGKLRTPHPPSPRLRRANIALRTGVAVALIGIALGAWAWWPRAAAPAVEAVAFVGKRLEARAADGRVLWHHEFDERVSGISFPNTKGPHNQFEAADLDGDGTTEWLVPVRFGDIRSGLYRSDALVAFSEWGTFRWTATIPVDFTLTCGGEPIGGPWALSAMNAPSRDDEKNVWVAFHHPVRWPSFLAEVTPDGAVHHRYVQSGWIRGVLERETAGGRQVAIAGVLNDRERASLVTIDPTVPMSVIPALSPEFACETGASQAPVRAVLFPPHDVTAAYLYKFFLATGVYHHGDGLRVDLSGGSAVAMLDAAGVVTDMTFIDDYWLQHDELYRAGRIDHPSDSCPQVRMPGEVESWDGSVWSTYPVRRVLPAAAPRTPH